MQYNTNKQQFDLTTKVRDAKIPKDERLNVWKQLRQTKLDNQKDSSSDYALILKCELEILNMCETKIKFYNQQLQKKTKPIQSNIDPSISHEMFNDLKDELIFEDFFVQTNTSEEPTAENSETVQPQKEIAEETSQNQEPTSAQIGQYQQWIQQSSLEIKLLQMKIVHVDKQLTRRIDTLTKKVDELSTQNTSHQSKDKPSLKQSIISAFHHLKKEWKNYDKQNGTVDEFFTEHGDDTFAGYKAQSRFYNWLSTNKDTRFVFDLEPYKETLEECRKKYQSVDWKNDKTPGRFNCFKVPHNFGHDAKTSGNQKLTQRRITEAWKKAVSFSEKEMEMKNGKEVPKADFYERDENGGATHPLTMFGSNMPPDNYDLVFD